ncbi:MAG: peptidylprolyl isomerase [Acidobacteriia bacterium]|nr:peptidylprolyl isomerase [Terriglobia bacterium]
MKNAFLSSIMLLAAVCAAALAQTKSAPAPAAKSAPKAGAPKAATKAKAGPNLLDPSTLNAKAPPVYLVKLNTTKGPIVIRVTKNWAPIGADRFYNLVRAGFYNNNVIFRSTKQFAQFGIPSRPEISRVWMEHTMFDDRPIQSNKRAMVTFASTGDKNSRSVQVFISKVDNGYLDSMGFAPFGEVIEGLDNLDMLYTGYGEQVTNLQGEIMNQGNAFLEKNFPRLDKITTAVIEPLPAEPPKDEAKKDDAKQ